MESNCEDCHLKEGNRAKCTLEYQAQSHNHLSLEKDDVVIVKSTFQYEKGKVLVSFRGKEGLVPFNFLILEDDLIKLESTTEVTQEIESKELKTEDQKQQFACLVAQLNKVLAPTSESCGSHKKENNDEATSLSLPPELPNSLDNGTSLLTPTTPAPALPTGLLVAIQNQKLRKVEVDEGYEDGTSKEETKIMKPPLLAEIERKVVDRVPILNIDEEIAKNKSANFSPSGHNLKEVIQRRNSIIKSDTQTLEDFENKIKANKKLNVEQENNTDSEIKQNELPPQKEIVDESSKSSNNQTLLKKKSFSSIKLQRADKPESGVSNELQRKLSRRLSFISGEVPITPEIKKPKAPLAPPLAPKPNVLRPVESIVNKIETPCMEDMEELPKAQLSQSGLGQSASSSPLLDNSNFLSFNEIENNDDELPPPPIDLLEEQQQSPEAEIAEMANFPVPPPMPVAILTSVEVNLPQKSEPSDTRTMLMNAIKTGLQLKPINSSPSKEKEKVSPSKEKAMEDHMKAFVDEYRKKVADSDEENDEEQVWEE